MAEYAFCESVTAGPRSFWHIRHLTDKGWKYGGGADTKALCGRKVAWDLRVKITDFNITNNCCQKCQEAYKAECSTPTTSSSPE